MAAAANTTGRTMPPTRQELLAQLEKLERTVSTVRARNRLLARTGKEAQERITALEDEVTRLQAARKPAAAAWPRKRRERDPGDAVPPGVAVAEPAPLDEEAAAARARLEEISQR